jgi:hypothetical protein
MNFKQLLCNHIWKNGEIEKLNEHWDNSILEFVIDFARHQNCVKCNKKRIVKHTTFAAVYKYFSGQD